MLYDPKWEQKTEADPPPKFSLVSLIAWLEKQPADTEYNYAFAAHCVLGQWLSAMGVREHLADTSLRIGQYDPFEEIALGEGGDTFGAALARARKLADPYDS